ncbi:MAG: hypothetical protein ACK5LY_00380 [Lachnospirales bacterium]
MDCQTLLENNLQIVKNKRLGRVVFVVEGNKTEILLLKVIFMNILGYSYISHNRNNTDFKFINPKDKNSVVYVFNSANSNIKSILNAEVIADEVTAYIQEKYEKDFAIEYAAIYYLFDRDYKSNKSEIVVELIEKYGNARDILDNYGRQGMLLLSYPCIEAYFMECLQKNYERFRFSLGKELKPFIEKKKKNPYKIKEQNLIIGFRNSVKMARRLKIKYIDLDDFSECNKTIFNEQEKLLEKYNSYNLFSTLSFALLDLGVIKCDVGKKKRK